LVGGEKAQAAAEEVKKLLDASHIKEI